MTNPMLGKRVFAVGDIYGDRDAEWDANAGDKIVTDTGIAGESRMLLSTITPDRKTEELVYVQFDQPDGTNIPDRHTSRWVARKALCTSRFGHANDLGKPCVFCAYQESVTEIGEDTATEPCWPANK